MHRPLLTDSAPLLWLPQAQSNSRHTNLSGLAYRTHTTDSSWLLQVNSIRILFTKVNCVHIGGVGWEWESATRQLQYLVQVQSVYANTMIYCPHKNMHSENQFTFLHRRLDKGTSCLVHSHARCIENKGRVFHYTLREPYSKVSKSE